MPKTRSNEIPIGAAQKSVGRDDGAVERDGSGGSVGQCRSLPGGWQSPDAGIVQRQIEKQQAALEVRRYQGSRYKRSSAAILLDSVEAPFASFDGLCGYTALRTIGGPDSIERVPARRVTRYADSETNYCVRCQTGGKLLADRALSRLLGADWPRTMDELEALKRQ